MFSLHREWFARGKLMKPSLITQRVPPALMVRKYHMRHCVHQPVNCWVQEVGGVTDEQI